MARLYISVDQEGIGGVTGWAHEGMPGGHDYDRMREWMTDEALAVVEAALAAGIDEVVVSDSHGTGQNLLLDRFPADRVTLVRSWPRPLGMMDGIDSPASTGDETPFVGACLIGYHAGASEFDGTMRHTLSSRMLREVRLNGAPMSETMLAAAIAGHHGVPVLLVSGDDAYVQQAQAMLGPVQGVVTKWTRGYGSVRTHTPAACREMLSRATTAALAAPRPPLFVKPGPLTLELDFHSPGHGEVLALLPGVQRIACTAVRLVLDDIVAVTRFLSFVIDHGPEVHV